MESLTLPSAKAFVDYVRNHANHVVTLKGARCLKDMDLVWFELETSAPQKPHVPILRREPLAVVWLPNSSVPMVLCLREDFPDTEHQQWVPDNWPAAICFDDRPAVEAQLTSTAAELLERVTTWFQRAARGELHDEANQPLDPFFILSEYSFIVPRTVLSGNTTKELHLFSVGGPDPKTFVGVPRREGASQNKNLPQITTVAYRVDAKRMTRLRKAPTTLGSLADQLTMRGVDVLADLGERMKEWYGDTADHASRLQGPLAIIVEFPIMSPKGIVTTKTDIKAFVPGLSVGELGVALGTVLQAASKDEGAKSGFARRLIAGTTDKTALAAIPLTYANVYIEFDQDYAAELSGIGTADLRKAALVGAGAIGSHVAMTLAREGRFHWTVIDDDILLPHNLARHTLTFWNLDQTKAAGLTRQLSSLRPPTSEPKAIPIPANILRPAEYADRVKNALSSADVIIDASASLAAARHLSDHESKARRTSTFFNPAGEAVVVLTEPKDRSATLRDLEAQYYRLVLRSPELESHLSATGERFAYTGACRALTNRIPENQTGLLSSLSAKGVAHSLGQEAGYMRVWTTKSDGSVDVITANLAAVSRTQLQDWTVSIDEGLQKDMMRMRRERLPAETGGSLLGIVDALAKTIHIVEALAAPPDSVEDRVSFERGVAGLEKELNDAMKRTAAQIKYVGEWHSHPRWASVMPSATDAKQLVWLAGVLELEGRPGVMVIAGEKKFNVLAIEIRRK